MENCAYLRKNPGYAPDYSTDREDEVSKIFIISLLGA